MMRRGTRIVEVMMLMKKKKKKFITIYNYYHHDDLPFLGTNPYGPSSAARSDQTGQKFHNQNTIQTKQLCREHQDPPAGEKKRQQKRHHRRVKGQAVPFPFH